VAGDLGYGTAAMFAVPFAFMGMCVKLTEIRTQQRERGRLNIYLDGEYAFSLQAILAARLTIGQELSPADVDALKAADAVEQAYERALTYLDYRPRSANEMRRYLAKRMVTPQVIEQVISRLERSGLIDDGQFAAFWVENREAFRPRGAWALRAELREKGVPDEAIESALCELDERASAMRAAEPAARRYARQERQEFVRHMLAFLQRRGFSYSVARQVTEHYWEQAEGARDSLRE